MQRRAENRAGVTQSSEPRKGILASSDTHEASHQKSQDIGLAARLKEETDNMGVNMRPLMAAFRIRRPQEQIQVSESMELYRLRDPMDELTHYYTSEWMDRIKSTYRSYRQWYRDFSVDPDGLFYYFWERMIVFLICVTFFLNTYTAFFQSYSELLDENLTGYFLLIIAYSVDLVLLIDFSLQFFIQINTPNGKITKHQPMREAYMKSWRFWCDMTAVLPFEFFIVFIPNNGVVFHDVGDATGQPMDADDFFSDQMQWLSYVKLNRCLKIFAFPGFFDRWTDDLTASTAPVRLLKFIIYVLISLQLGASLLIAGTCTSTVACPTDPNFFWTAPAKTPNITIDSPNPYWYTTSLYYAATLLTTTGYGDLYPHNYVEQIISNIGREPFTAHQQTSCFIFLIIHQSYGSKNCVLHVKYLFALTVPSWKITLWSLDFSGFPND